MRLLLSMFLGSEAAAFRRRTETYSDHRMTLWLLLRGSGNFGGSNRDCDNGTRVRAWRWRHSVIDDEYATMGGRNVAAHRYDEFVARRRLRARTAILCRLSGLRTCFGDIVNYVSYISRDRWLRLSIMQSAYRLQQCGCWRRPRLTCMPARMEARIHTGQWSSLNGSVTNHNHITRYIDVMQYEAVSQYNTKTD